MPSRRGVTEVTEPVQFEVIDDRVHFTLASGGELHRYSISFHKARNAAHVCVAILDRQERERNGTVRPLQPKRYSQRADPSRHG